MFRVLFLMGIDKSESRNSASNALKFILAHLFWLPKILLRSATSELQDKPSDLYYKIGQRLGTNFDRNRQE